jgi:hypothetical protein
MPEQGALKSTEIWHHSGLERHGAQILLIKTLPARFLKHLNVESTVEPE